MRSVFMMLLLLVAATANAQAPKAPAIDVIAARLAVEDLTQTFGAAYPRGHAYLAQIDRFAKENNTAGLQKVTRRALLDNPLLRFDRLLFIRRDEKQLGLSNNWESNSSLPRSGYDNELAVLDPRAPEGKTKTVFRPKGARFLGDVDLDFDAKRLLFSSTGENNAWNVFELGLDTDKAAAVPLPLIPDEDVDNYDACYLPDGNVIFCSTATFTGVPCVQGSAHVCNLYRWNRAANTIRRLTFEQDHDWCPTVLEDGRVGYLRWEYTDIPHFVSRIMFQMKPDGTGQTAWYGSNSYWPNSMFYARPLPGYPSRFVAVVSGHHDVPRMGELVVFDAARGRYEADGAVQRIPGRGKKVEPVLRDGLVKDSWPKFLHPYPLNDKYFLVSCKPGPDKLWGLYLADVFDNLTLLREEPGKALLEPLPLAPRTRPPVIADTTDTQRSDGVVYLADIYAGNGLKDVPKGTVKSLRLFTYQFAYRGMGGQVNRVGLDGPWDVKRILGTVPVEPDGSAFFRVPANTPISVQPLDEGGRAIQLMRSWMTAMPGETVSCVGCHEKTDNSASAREGLAARRAASEIKPWYGPARGFSFDREVQPVIDANCVACHRAEQAAPDLTARPHVRPECPNPTYRDGTQFPPSYLALYPYLRTATIESDMHLLTPYEFHTSTVPLMQMLERGHHGVRLDAEAMDRLVTWLDLNAPAHGTWREIVGDEKVLHFRDRRQEMMARYAPGTPLDDPEAVGVAAVVTASPRKDVAAEEVLRANKISQAPAPKTRAIDLGGLTLQLAYVPAPQPFWMATTETTNAQYALFDGKHDSRLERGNLFQFSVEERGYPLNTPPQPAVRVSWDEAQAFCQWLSARTGEAFALPTREQWEFACQAETVTPQNFAAYENLADDSFVRVDSFEPWKLPYDAVPPYRLACRGVDDGFKVSAPVASFKANAWGLYDLLGNAAEWTASETPDARRIACGASWAARPASLETLRAAYLPWQAVYNVGFRVICSAR